MTLLDAQGDLSMLQEQLNSLRSISSIARIHFKTQYSHSMKNSKLKRNDEFLAVIPSVFNLARNSSSSSI